MTELRDTARKIKLNLETLEGRTLLSSAIVVSLAAVCADTGAEHAPAQPAITASSGSEKHMTTLSLGSASLAAEFTAAQAAMENALAAAIRSAEIASQGGPPAMHGGGSVSYGSISYNDTDGDDPAGHIGHGPAERLAPPALHPHLIYFPGEAGAIAPQTPGGSGSTSASGSASSSVAPALNVAIHGSAAAISGMTVIPPRGGHLASHPESQDSAASVVDSLVARVAPASSAPLGIARVTSGSLRAAGEIGGTLTTAIARIAAEYAQVAAEAARIARGVITAPAQAIPTVAGTLESIGSIAQTPQRLFHFERMSDPMLLIGDAAAEFAEESAMLGAGTGQAQYVKAWGITASVVLVDAAVLVYYIQTRRRRHAAASANGWTYEMAGGEVE